MVCARRVRGQLDAVPTEWLSGLEWTATVDVEGIARRGEKVQLTSREVSRNAHYTHVIITDLRRNIQARTEETLRAYLGSMYMFDLKKEQPVPVKITYNTTPIEPPSEADWDTDLDGKPYMREIPVGMTIGGKSIAGFVGVLKRAGGASVGSRFTRMVGRFRGSRMPGSRGRSSEGWTTKAQTILLHNV